MGTLLRSRCMQLVQLYIPIDAAHDTIDELGKTGLVQFRDLNPDVNAFQRNFVDEVKRADEMERKLRYFEDLLKKNDLFEESKKLAHVRYSEFVSRQALDDEDPAGVVMNKLQDLFEFYEQELVRLNVNQEALERSQNKLIELNHVLTQNNHPEFSAMYANFVENQPLVDGSSSAAASIGASSYITGTVNTQSISSFHKLLYRAMRGNVYFRHAEIEEKIKDPSSGDSVEKSVFFILYTGTRSETKIRKLCEAFGANIYDCPKDEEERTAKLAETRNQEQDASNVLERTRDSNVRLLREVRGNLDNWKIMVMKEKAIYHTMNLFNYDSGRRCLIAEGWCPTDAQDMEAIHEALRNGNLRSDASVPSILSVVETTDAPPTYFVTNRFTECFQNVIDAYGIARYRELNPAPLTIVTFPFLFGVMFGDIGHGFMLFLIALVLVIKEEPLGKIKLPEMVDTLYEGRWLFLLMTIASMYCGLLYNEFFGLPMNLFGSDWTYSVPYYKKMFATEAGNYLYPLGVDPLWKGANNELFYYNSLKMKTSVCMGVVQMLVGIVMSAYNAIYFATSTDPKAKKTYWLNIFMEFVPQMILILSIFGYMDILIIFKWITDWTNPQYIYNMFSAPRLLNLMIQMFLTPLELGPCNHTWDTTLGVSSLEDQPWAIPQHLYSMYDGQVYIQVYLTLMALFSMPWMLLLKPLVIKYYHDKENPAKGDYEIVDDSSDVSDEDGEEEEEFEFGELVTHQAIHTIEYVLGCISNTASYLRLWALSLAHAELSAVFWERVMQYCIDINQWPAIFGAWATWAALTVGILLVMESLSAFLHALRLHWVEFQNKFYLGDGHKFTPLEFKAILQLEDEGGAMPSS
mmetsp:Transcript_1664/g.5908  ORF Transcript_1664/g.5908 Transcript_1664/m.5908 type:complete len:860 (-) Transcript_1664:40-2619(-)